MTTPRTENLPLLTLRDVVIFPSVVTPLFVGREKSINALNEVMKGDKKILLVIFLAFTFSVLLRYIWVDQFQNVEAFKWLGQLMINTNDGYYFAEGARDIISGVHQNLDSSPIDNPVSQLTALLVKILPFSFETIILWMPAFLGSLLVVPLVLIGNSLKQPIVGIIAGFLAPITWSYYNRTMTGYYDTDMLTIVLPTFIVWGIVSSLLNKENRFLLIAPIFTILYLFWYQQGSSLSLGLAGMLFLYTVIFERKEIYNYKLLSFMFIALAPVSALIKLPILLIAFGVIYWLQMLQKLLRTKFYNFYLLRYTVK